MAETQIQIERRIFMLHDEIKHIIKLSLNSLWMRIIVSKEKKNDINSKFYVDVKPELIVGCQRKLK